MGPRIVQDESYENQRRKNLKAHKIVTVQVIANNSSDNNSIMVLL